MVEDLSLEIRAGEIFGLLGPNGAGKSTTINMISGVVKLGGGSVTVFGHDNQRDYLVTRRLVGVMHQEIIIDNFFPIGQTLKLYAGYFGLKDEPKWRELLIDRLDLRPHLGKKMLALSGGMRRRFMVAKALIHRPSLLILDEPTAGVDVELRIALWNFIREIRAQGTTVLLTTHYLEEAEKICDRIAIMDQGRIVALEPTADLIAKLGERRLTLHFSKPLGSLPSSLARLGFALDPSGARGVVALAHGEKPGDLLDAVYREGIRIDNLEESKPGLEEVFLKLTRKRPEERAK